jgi:hypothetical protein
MPLLKELLDRRAAVDFVGREEELGLLLQMLDPAGPFVVYLHGIAGTGKTTLLEAFTRRVRSAAATVIRLDCQAIEPTEAGLLSELAVATGAVPGSADEVAARLGQIGTRVIVALDTYESFRLMDTWLRHVFFPLLPDNVRFVLCGRKAPASSWSSAPGWHGLFKTVELGSLDQRSALELLYRAGVPPEEARHLEGICHGHPLALTLAASLQVNAVTSALSPDVGRRIVEELSRLYVADIRDLQTRRALQAASVVRRVTVPLLAAMLPDMSPQDTQERIRALPFVRADKDGLRIHDAVREAVALTMRAENPRKYREYRRAAYRHIACETRKAGVSDLWRCNADLLYVLENPSVREAFFPTGAQEHTVEPAQARDEPKILEIIGRHEQPGMAGCLTKWLARAPETFAVTRDRKGAVVGFYCAFDPTRYPTRSYNQDPITRMWVEDLERRPLTRPQCALFLRRWLALEGGESPSAVQAACWVDMKRKYLELRPNLRRVYLTVRDLTPYATVAQTLGFRVLPESNIQSEGESYSTAMLDFGPSSVDGWLARLVAEELGVEDSGLLDYAARELAVNGRRVSLSKLEFGVMEYLQRHAGQAISRTTLLEKVWEQSYDGGSNVVDVIIRALRKKLAEKAFVIETVQGVGYRLRPE